MAALVLSGGQGTRLGFDGPKGMYDIGLPSGKPIFQLLAERVRGLSRLAGMPAGRTLPFYVMTSPLNHDVTRCVRRAGCLASPSLSVEGTIQPSSLI